MDFQSIQSIFDEIGRLKLIFQQKTGAENKKNRQKIKKRIGFLFLQLAQNSSNPELQNPTNYILESEPGCYVAFSNSEWIISCNLFDHEEFDLEPGDAVPDMLVDPETKILSVINTSNNLKTISVTLYHKLFNKNGAELEMGLNRNSDGQEERCSTLISLTPPGHQIELCYVDVPQNRNDLKVKSHISDVLENTEKNNFETECVFSFPLGGLGPYLCSQGFGGGFTHYFHGTYHAVDFECPVGTPVLAVGDGTIVDVKDQNVASGIDIQNLFDWNSITIQLDSGFFIDYVHIRNGSVLKQKGCRVQEGEKICESGDVGFCPLPHLHFQVQRSDHPSAPTVMFGLRSQSGEFYFPVAGKWYNFAGISQV